MARTYSAALLAALIAAAPLAGLAQTATETTTPAPAAPAADTAPEAPAADAATPAADAATPAADAAAPAADAAAPAADAAAPAADAAAPAAPAAAAPAPDAAAPAADAPAAAASGEPQVGSYYTKATHGDWQLRCLRAPQGTDPCELYQLLKDDQGSAVSEVSVIPFTGRAAAVVNFVTPLETDLTTGLGFQIDSGNNAKFPFLVCAPIGCIARVGMTDAELTSLKNGNAATVSLLPYGGEEEENTVRLTMSLKGFTAGFDALVAASPAPAEAPAAAN